MRIERALMNPLISPLHVTPSSPEMQVVSAFNAAATTWGDETILLLRVAEIPKDVPDDEVAVPIVERTDGKAHISVRRFRKGTPGLDTRDPRAVIFNGEILLTRFHICAWRAAKMVSISILISNRRSFRRRNTRNTASKIRE